MPDEKFEHKPTLRWSSARPREASSVDKNPQKMNVQKQRLLLPAAGNTMLFFSLSLTNGFTC